MLDGCALPLSSLLTLSTSWCSGNFLDNLRYILLFGYVSYARFLSFSCFLGQFAQLFVATSWTLYVASWYSLVFVFDFRILRAHYLSIQIAVPSAYSVVAIYPYARFPNKGHMMRRWPRNVLLLLLLLLLLPLLPSSYSLRTCCQAPRLRVCAIVAPIAYFCPAPRR